MTSKLQACPFCAHDMSLVTWIANDADSLEAMEAPLCPCGAQGPMYPTRAEAIAAWNTRSAIPLPVGGDGEAERLAVIVANIKQGESDNPRCEPPGRYEVTIARQWVDRVLAALQHSVPSVGGSDEEVSRG